VPRDPSAARARADAAAQVRDAVGNGFVEQIVGGGFLGPDPAPEPVVEPAAAPTPEQSSGTTAGLSDAPGARTATPTGPAPSSTGDAGAAQPEDPALLAGASGFFGREPAEPHADEGTTGPGRQGEGGASPASPKVVGGREQVVEGPPPPPGQPQTLTEWGSAVDRAAQAMPHPRVALGGGAGGGSFAPVVQGSKARNEKARADIAGSSGRHVPTRPHVPEPVKPPPDPVPEATKKVSDAVARTLPDFPFPPLLPTPSTGRQPKLVPAPPPPPPKEPVPPAKGAKPSAGPGRKPPAGQPDVKAADQPQPQPALKDVRVPLGQPLRPDLAMRVGDVVGKLLTEIEPITDDTLRTARAGAFSGGKLVARFPELDEPIRPDLLKALTEQVNLIGDLAGISRERVQTAAKARVDALAQSKTGATVPTEKEAKAAADAVKKGERKTADAIAKERGKTLKETSARMHKALTSVNPQFIIDVQDELISNLRVQATRGAAQHRRAVGKRTDQLATTERQYIDAYRRADNEDIPSTARGIPSINVDRATGRPWLDVRLEELAATIKEATRLATTWGEALALATEAAGLEAYELVRVWAATRLHQERSIDAVRIEKFADQRAQAERRSLAEAEVKAQEARNALVGDIMLIDELTKTEGASADAQEKAGAVQLTAEERKAAEQYFGLGTGDRDPLAALARTTRGRLIREQQAELVKKYREAIEKIDPASFGKDLDKYGALSAVLLGDEGRARQICHKLFKAMDVVGTEEDDIYAALAGLTPKQAQLVRALYQASYDTSLDAHLRSEMSGSELKRAQALAAGDRIAGAAEAIYDAVDGPGTNEKTVYETLRNLTPEELVQVKAYYLKHHHETMDKALRDDFSDRELQRALALSAGDKHQADAYAIDEALHGSIWGPDRKGLEEVHKQISDDVAAANPTMTSEELAKEVRRRTGEVEASYEKRPGGGGMTLKTAYETSLKGPTRDLAIALVDNDLDGADSARFAIEAKAAQEEGRQNADDQFNDIVKARHERMMDRARRDNIQRLNQGLSDEIQARAAQGNPMPPWERQKKEREIQVELARIAQGLSKDGMSTLEKRFDEKYTGTWSRYDPNTGAYTQQEGGFKVMSQLLSSGPETKDYLDKGYLTLAEEIRYSVQGAGTNEDRLKNVTKGRTKAEIAAARKEYKDRWKEDMDWRIHDEVDAGTRDGFDIDENLLGVPETPAEMLNAAHRRYTFETTTYGAGGLFELAPAARKVLDEDYKQVQKAFTRLNDPDPAHRPKGADLDEMFDRLDSSVKTFESSTEAYRASVDAMVDVIIQAVAATVAIIVIAATWGTATPVVAALYGSLWGTVATVYTKMILLGRAYGVEDLGKDLALGAVDAAVAAATAGMGDKLLKAAKGAANPGVLARMAASSSRTSKLLAKASAELIEQTAQAAPNAIANTLADDNTYRGDVFKNLLKGTAMGTVQGVGQGLVMGAAMKVGIHLTGSMAAGLRSMRGLPTPDAVAIVDSLHARAAEAAQRPGAKSDALSMRGTLQERAAAWAEFRQKYPGASYERDFLPALDRGSTLLVAHADAVHQLDRQLRKDLMAAIPPELRAQFADTPIHVVSDADFEAFGRSQSAQAVVVFEQGKARVIVRESAASGALREEGIHLWQSVDPRTRKLVQKLDEARLSKWDTLSAAEKIDLYQAKLALEIDGQLRMLGHLEGELRAPGLDPTVRAMLEADLRLAKQTLDNLGAIKGRVDTLGPDDILRISRGEAKSPVDLDQPSRLFHKRKKAPWVGVSEEDAVAALGEVVPVTDLAAARRAVNAYRLGPEFHIHADGPYRHVMWETASGERGFTVEKRDVNGKWVERGERRRGRGLSLETEASAKLTRAEAAKALASGERHISLDKAMLGVNGPGGFDEVILILRADGTAVLKLVEVKNVNGYVSWAEITAVDDAMRHNLNAMRAKLTASLPDLALTHRLSDADQVAIKTALIPRGTQIQVEFRLGPKAKMAEAPGGVLKTGSVAQKLEADLRRRYGGGVSVLPPVEISQGMVDAARANLKAKPTKDLVFDRTAELAKTASGITSESVRRAHALALAEVAAPYTLGFVQPSDRPDLFHSQTGSPISVVRPTPPPSGPFDPRAVAADVMGALSHPLANPVLKTQELPHLVVDFGGLTKEQEALVRIEIARLATASSSSASVDARLHGVRTGAL